MDVAVVRLTPIQVLDRAQSALGLSRAKIDPLSTAGVAASLRRTASFLCPATSANLIAATCEAYAGLLEPREKRVGDVTSVLSDLIGYGDLLELRIDLDGRDRRQLFLAEPAYVRLSDHSALLLGIRPEAGSLVSDDVIGRIEYREHARMIRSEGPVRALLADEGLIELTPNQWINAPRRCSAQELVEAYSSRLAAAGEAGDVEGLTIIDPDAKVTYYAGRRRPLSTKDNGTFVARRPQAYGADLWCFINVIGGRATALVDLPVFNTLATGADEAWRLQAAFDAIALHPQHIRVREGDDVDWLDAFSPLPSWAQKRLATISERTQRAYGALFSYTLGKGEAMHEARYLSDMMWTLTDWGDGLPDA